MTERVGPTGSHDEVWFRKWLNFTQRYLHPDFCLMSSDMKMTLKDSQGKRCKYYLSQDNFPGFAKEKIERISISLEKIVSVDKFLQYADLRGDIVYDTARFWQKRKKWHMDMLVGDVLDVANVPNLYQTLAANIHLFQLKEINREKSYVVIGPIEEE